MQGLSEITESLVPLLVSRAPAARPRTQVVTPSRVRMAVLSGVAGFVDAAGFVTLAGLFPAHITGELVGAAAGMSAASGAVEASRLSVIAVFLGAVVVGALVSRAFRQRGRSPLAALFGLMALLLLLFSATGGLLPWLVRAESPFNESLKRCSVVAAMGLQNVVMRHALTSSCPTTVMTGNLTQFIVELVELLLPRMKVPGRVSERPSKSQVRLRVLGTALGAFLLSATLGGALTSKFGAISVSLPALAVALLAIREVRYPTAPTRTGTLF